MSTDDEKILIALKMTIKQIGVTNVLLAVIAEKLGADLTLANKSISDILELPE